LREFAGKAVGASIAVCYLARDTHLDRDVVISLLKTEQLDQSSVVRLRREAQTMGRLAGHPHIVTVHDIG